MKKNLQLIFISSLILLANYSYLNAQSISAGGNHSHAICLSDSLISWGNNNFGQFGDGTNTPSSTPVRNTQLSYFNASECNVPPEADFIPVREVI